MATPTEADRQVAHDIMADTGGDPRETRRRIAQALAAARESGRPPKGHVLTDDGTVRRVVEAGVNPINGCTYLTLAAEAARKEATTRTVRITEGPMPPLTLDEEDLPHGS